jgi:hypothetical protein
VMLRMSLLVSMLFLSVCMILVYTRVITHKGTMKMATRFSAW